MSIFSRLKKPAPIEPSPAVDTTVKARSSEDKAPAGPAPAASPPDDKARRAAEAPPPAAKPNGAPAQAAKTPAVTPAPPPPAPTPTRANGVIEAKAAPVLAAPAVPPAAPAKQADLSRTMLYGASTPSPRQPTPRPAVVQPPAPPPVATPEPMKVSFDVAIEMALGPDPAANGHGASTASDQAALRATFEDLAVPYVADVRSVMMELRWGEVQASWLESARPVLKSLRKMAEPVGHSVLVEAIDRFDAALAEVLAPGQSPTPSAAARDALLAAYEPLRACLPRGFDLEGERDRREPLIVRALLDQVPGLEPLMIDKMLAAGFGKLSALTAARADELAAVTGIPDVIAAATVARFQAFRRTTPAGLASVDRGATIRELARLLETLRTQHVAFEEVSRSWSEGDRSAKRQRRRERQQTLLQLTIELARLGEVDLALRLEKLAFAKKLEELDRMISQAALSAPTKSRSEAPVMAAAAAAS